MKKSYILTITLILASFLFSTELRAQKGMIKIESQYSVDETVNRLEQILNQAGITIFKKVNHAEGASSVDMNLRPTTLVIFGNPKLGTPLMQCAQTTAIDLPQKMLIWKNTSGTVNVGYNSAEYLKRRHNIEGCDQELKKVSKALKKFAQGAAGKN